MARLKGVIFGVENVLAPRGSLEPHQHWLDETGRLVRFLCDNGVESVVMTNREWRATENGRAESGQAFLERIWGVRLSWYRFGHDGMPGKQSPEAFQHICHEKGWQANETVYVGNSIDDMRTSVNSKILLLNAKWYADTMDYGFPFAEPKDVARFIDIFCLREPSWAFRLEEVPLSVYTLATFSTMYEPHAEYSRDFLRNIKDEYGHDEQFWAKYLCSTLYFTGLYENINYITSYPCHSQGDFPEVLIEPVTRFAKCFRGNYIPDLIVRHTTATKSQTSRATVDHLNQLRTIRLNPNPLKRGAERYASSPLCSGKTVLVIDDVCSKGMSFEAARAYLEATGCRVISVALLKALRHGYEALHQLQMRPYQTNTPTAVRVRKTYPYRDHLLSDAAAVELRDRLRRYRRWDWPDGSTHA